jgi:hypothetical protein
VLHPQWHIEEVTYSGSLSSKEIRNERDEKSPEGPAEKKVPFVPLSMEPRAHASVFVAGKG